MTLFFVSGAHSVESGMRSYRGFRAYGNTYLSTGVAGGRTYPSDGSPLPSGSLFHVPVGMTRYPVVNVGAYSRMLVSVPFWSSNTTV